MKVFSTETHRYGVYDGEVFIESDSEGVKEIYCENAKVSYLVLGEPAVIEYYKDGRWQKITTDVVSFVRKCDERRKSQTLKVVFN